MKDRKRASRDKVRENAAKGASGGSDWFDLPEEVGRWTPDKPGRYSIDILPYEVASKNHPDDVEKGCLWYKFPFAVHHSVGVNKNSVVCPRSIGQPCPICDERDRLYKDDADKHEDIISTLKPQKFVAYNVLDPQDDNKISLFIMSRGKFAAPLENELKDPANEGHLAFFDINEDGRTLNVRFSEATFEGKKYMEATKIDFDKRKEMDEDAILDKVVCLETSLIVMPFDKLKSMFFQEVETEEAPATKAPVVEKEEDEEEAPIAKPAPKATANPVKEEEEDEDDDKGKPKCKACGGTGKSSSGKMCRPCEGTGLADAGTEDGDEGDEDEKPAAKAPAKNAAQLTCPECDDEFEAEDAEHSDKLNEDFCSKKCLKRAESKAPVKAADEEEEEEAPKKKAPAAAPAKEKGASKGTPQCPVKGGKFGNVDQYDECDDCPHWNECEEASG